MQITFTRWCLDHRGRTQVSVDPTRVDVTEQFSEGFKHAGTLEEFPAATRIIMRNKQEYMVQGSHDAVVRMLNSSVK